MGHSPPAAWDGESGPLGHARCLLGISSGLGSCLEGLLCASLLCLPLGRIHVAAKTSQNMLNVSPLLTVTFEHNVLIQEDS